jgi:excisionase family DNA binding protein
MPDLLTTKQVARAIGISESSLKRWCDRGLIQTHRTAGGHRRLALCDVLSFLRQSGQKLENPECLGMALTSGCGERCLERGRNRLFTSLTTGNEEEARQVLVDLYLSKYALTTIIDEVITPTFCQIKTQGLSGELEIYKERMSSKTCMRLLHEMSLSLSRPAVDAPYAIGGTPSEDYFTLTLAATELVLRDMGWKANSLGANLPFCTLHKAMEDLKPQLFWMTISHIQNVDELVSGLKSLQQKADEMGILFLCDGCKLSDEIIEQSQIKHPVKWMKELREIASKIYVQHKPCEAMQIGHLDN